MNEIKLQLERLDDLFNATAFSVDKLELNSGPGLEYVATQLRLRGGQGAGRLVVRLTAEAVTPERRAAARRALHKFCAANVAKNHLEARLIRHSGWQALRIGLFALAVLLGLSAAVEQSQLLPPVLNDFLSNGLVIIGWVVLWNPAEMLLYEWVAPHRLAKIYERIGGMEFELSGTEMLISQP